MRRSAVLLLAVVAVAGCSSKLDPAGTEKAISAGVAKQFDVTVKAVRCPDDVEARKGGRFRCRVRAADGSRGTAVVTQADDEGHVRVRLPFVQITGVERL